MTKTQNTLTTAQAAAHFGVSLTTIYRRIAKGDLNGTKIDGRWVITLDTESTPTIEDQIRAIYAALVEGPQAWISLAYIRPLIEDATPAEVDEELRRMEREEGFHLVPQADQKSLTGADRAAAVEIGGVAKHLIAIS